MKLRLSLAIVYEDLASFPTPRIELGAVHKYKVSWRRLQCPAMDSEAKETMFLLIHNKLPVSERLFRIGVKVALAVLTVVGL